MEVFVGVDLAEACHDVCVKDHSGGALAERRVLAVLADRGYGRFTSRAITVGVCNLDLVDVRALREQWAAPTWMSDH